jgi:acetyl esterase/lipase
MLALALARGASPLELPVWDGVPPGSEKATEKETWEERGKDGVTNRAVRQVHRPTITVHRPAGNNTGVAVLIAPGGGNEHVTIDLEGHEVARWLASQGITGIVLKYRLSGTPGGIYTAEHPLADAMQALKVIRRHAAEWGIVPAKIGMMGFSAGGTLTVRAGVVPEKTDRPAFLAPIYGGPPEGMTALPPDLAPMFLVHANNDRAENSVKLYTMARDQKISAELHLFASGGHGFGLGKPGTPPAEWPRLFKAWLVTNAFLPAAL